MKRLVLGMLGLLLLAGAGSHAADCQGAKEVREAAPAEVQAWFRGRQRTVLAFVGYSGAEYQDRPAMLAAAERALRAADPRRTIVLIGATPEGIGSVYEIAKRRGFETAGIVSTQAKAANARLSDCVDTVFYVPDATWGGLQPGSATLSPTSQAMVAAGSRFVAIGGGEIARDELLAARRAGKPVRFVPADFHHGLARDKAWRRGQEPPTDFRGAAHAAFAPKPR
jgi:hypothetical protein